MTQHQWTPEHTLDLTTAAALVAEQFPELAGLPVRAFDSGWDNVVVTVGDAWAFRFVHRQVALPGARRELAVLRHLADRFPVPIPHPVFVGTPTDAMPWPFWGTRLLPGQEIAQTPVPDVARTRVASAVGGFLRELHDPALARETVDAVERDGVELPVDPMRRADAATQAGRAREQLTTLVDESLWQPDPRVDALLATAAGAGPASGEPVLVHGDLHVRHLLVSADGEPTGVIDWGDTALGDPAIDLMVAYAAFVDDARAAFLTAYGDVPPDRELRARTLAVRVSSMLAVYAAAEGMTALLAEALACLDRAVR